MHIDLYGTISEKDFIIRTFQGLNQLESNFERLLKSVSSAIKNIKLNLSIDSSTGSTLVSPSFGAVDEFQEVADYTEEGFEKRLRSFIQQHSNICYLFSGSRQHLITEIFNSNTRAFYKLAESFPLSKIETKHYIPWIQNLFSRKNVHLPAEPIEEITARFENHPMYIQNFLFHLWGKQAKKGFSTDIINKVEIAIIEKRSLEYTILWETLSINQKKP